MSFLGSFLFLLFALSLAFSLRLNERILNYDQPSGLSISPSFSKRDLDSERFPYGDTLHVSFSAHGEDFRLNFVANTELVENAQFFQMIEGELVQQPTPMIAFKGISEDSRLTILDFEDQIFEGYTTKGHEVYLFVPASSEQMDPQIRSELTSSMLVVKLSDIVEDEDKPRYCGVRDQESEHYHAFQARQFEPAATSPIPTPCPQDPTTLTLGVATDASYETTYSSTRNQVISHVNQINGVYSAQTNIRIVLGRVFMGLSDSFAIGCSAIETKLNDFSRWRGNGAAASDEASGLYALFSTCYQSGTVGLAWIDVTCITESYNSGSDWFSGTSVSSIIGSSGYLVAVHEIGHNFGAGHDNDGGIMYPSTTGSTSFSRKSQTDVCNGYISNQEDTTCFVTTTCTPQCGGKTCGSNGCGGSCGSCQTGFSCVNSVCQPACVPNCQNKQCGADGCGGSCGTCTNGACSNSVCKTFDLDSDSEVYLTLLNDARLQYNLPALAWSNELASYAQDWADQCIWGVSRGPYGESISASTGHAKDPSSLIQVWLDEEGSWNCESNTCRSGTYCGSWTQIMWEETTQVGCFKQNCYGDEGLPPNPMWGTWTMLVCSFDPPGNILGERPFPISKCDGVQCATAETCSDHGVDCGEFVDICETTVDCGECSFSSQCVDNTCQCTPQTSCAAEGKTCGSITDGCGKTLDCGSCSAGEVCRNGRCSCQPTATCEGKSCGTIMDGCGNRLQCGTCPNGATCNNGVCSQSCQATSTCAGAHYECGEHDFGCGPVTCGFCGEHETCQMGQCVCAPTTTCEEAGRECGDFHDGCHRTSCGRCAEHHQCIHGICTTCSGCHQYAICANSVCSCIAGYVGDGFSCVAVRDQPEPSSPLGNWVVVEGDTNNHLNWRNTGEELQFDGNSGHDSTIYWTDVQNLPYSSTRIFSMKVFRHAGNEQFGFVFNAVDGFNVFVRWEKDQHSDVSGNWVLGYKVAESESLDKTTLSYWSEYSIDFVDYFGEPLTFPQELPLETWFVATLTIQGLSLIINADNSVTALGVDSTKLMDSGLGITASGPCSFSDITLVTSTEIYLSLTECVDEDVLISQVAGLLGIFPQLIVDHTVSCLERQGGASAVLTLSSVPNGPSSVALASQLQTMVASGHPLVGGVGLSASSVNLVTAPVPSGVPIGTVSPPATPTSAGGSGSASSGVIVASVVATVAAVGMIAAAAVFLVRQKARIRDQELIEFEDEDEPNVLFAPDTKFEKPRGGVDIYATRPEDVTSITARAPARVQKPTV